MAPLERKIFWLYVVGIVLGIAGLCLFVGACAGANDDAAASWSQPEVVRTLLLVALTVGGSVGCFGWARVLRRRRD
jgi:uncharacterized membrane protein